MLNVVKKIVFLMLAIVSLFLLNACESSVNDAVKLDNQAYIQVWDAYRRPVPYAHIAIADDVYSSDETGLLVIEKSLLDIAVITVMKEAYVTKIARVLPQTNTVVVFLMPHSQWQKIDAIEQAQTISVANIDLIIAANTFITAAGTVAEGSISLAITPWLPQGNLTAAIYASNLSKQTGGLAPLFSLAMFNLVMLDSEQKPLQIAEGKTITVRQTLSSDISLTPGQTLSLWQLDDTSGLWQKHQPARLTMLENTQLEAEITALGAWSWAHVTNNSRHIELNCMLENSSGAVEQVAANEACLVRVQSRYPDQSVSVVDIAVPASGATFMLAENVALSLLAFHLPSQSYAQLHYSADAQIPQTLDLILTPGILNAQTQAVFVDCQFIREGQLPLSVGCELTAGFRQQDDVFARWTLTKYSVPEGGKLLVFNAPKDRLLKFDVETAYMPECPLETDSLQKFLLYTNSLYKVEHLSFNIQCVDSIYSES